MGVVYRATQLDLDRPVALKLIAPELSQDEGFRERFVRESRIAAAIDHPHVIPIYYAGEEDGTLYLAMRYVDGEDLRAIVRRDGMLEPQRAAQIVAQIGGALDAAHARGLVHRDVKPANVLLTADDHAYLTDFGLSKRVFDTSARTRAGQWVGTLGYVAPEQIRGQRVDARTDVFALGCVLFFALSAATPFQRESDEATLWAHLNDPPEPVDVLAPDVPPAFGEVLDRALAKDPDDRFPSTGDLGRAALRAAGESVSPAPERLVARGAAAPGADDETIITGATPPTSERSATAMTTLGDDAIARRRRRLGILGLLAVAAVAAVTIAIVALGSSGGSSPTTQATTTATTTPRTTPTTQTTAANAGVQVDKTLHTGLRLNSIAVLSSTVWASANKAHRLLSFHRDDATRGEPAAKVAGTAAIAAGFGSLWLLNVRHGSLGRLRQGANKVKIEIPSLAGANQAIVLHTGDGSVWTGILTRRLQQDAIQRIDPNGSGTAKIVGTIPVRSGLIDFGIESGTLWILDQRDMLEGVRLKTGATRPRADHRRPAARRRRRRGRLRDPRAHRTRCSRSIRTRSRRPCSARPARSRPRSPSTAATSGSWARTTAR